MPSRTSSGKLSATSPGSPSAAIPGTVSARFTADAAGALAAVVSRGTRPGQPHPRGRRPRHPVEQQTGLRQAAVAAQDQALHVVQLERLRRAHSRASHSVAWLSVMVPIRPARSSWLFCRLSAVMSGYAE